MGLELLIGCLVVSGMLMTVPRAIADVVETVKAANAGQWDVIDRDRDRRAARTERWGKSWAALRTKRHQAAGGNGQYKPGARAYLGDVYSGWWADRIANRQAKREARGPVTWSPDGKPWHQRVDDAVFAAGRKARDAWQNRGNQAAGQPIADPAQPSKTADTSTSPVDDEQTPPIIHDTDRYKLPVKRRVYGWHCDTCGADVDGYESSSEAVEGSRTHPCKPKNAEGETTMTETSQAGTATGDAHNVETAIAECNALDDDLTAINTALDVIDERIDAAGTAAEGIEAFLASKNVDDTAVGGMSVARDMLSPTHIKALMDAVAAAKQGVRNAIEELIRLQELESQLNGADGSVLNGR